MARFYQTSNPGYVDDNMYQAPWELMQGVIETHEGRVDDMIAQSELLDGVVDTIQHLNFDAENKRVSEIRDRYNTTIDEVTSSIYENPLEYQKHLPALKKIQKDLLADKTSGEIFSIEQRYKDFQQWQESNKEIKEKNPGLYNQLSNHWYDDITSRATESGDATFKGQQIIDRPDLIEGYRQHFENIKTNATEYKDGLYKIKNEWLSEEEVADIAWNTLVSDKDYQGYVNQMGKILGLPGYIDDKGNPVQAFKLVDESGNTITPEQYNNLNQEEKKKVSRVLNSDNAFSSDLASVAQTYSTSNTSIKEDAFEKMRIKGQIDSGLESQRQQGRNQLEAAKQLNRLQMEAAKQQGDMKKLQERYKLENERDRNKFKDKLQLEALDGNEESKKALNTLNAKETIGTLGNPNANIDKDYQLIESRKEATGMASNDGKEYIYATPGTIEYSALQRRNNATDFAKKKFNSETIKLSNGSEIKGEDYLTWLGDRKHSEDLAEAFLKEELGVFQRASFESSSAGQLADNIRWTPGWTKSNMAQDWDKIYELGNKYEESRNEWYSNYSNNKTQINLEPINNIEANSALLKEIKNNSQSYFLTDAEGNTPKGMRDIMSKIDPSTTAYLTPSNTHSEMGVKVEVEGQDYYVFPDNTNVANSNLAVNLAMMGANKDSQFFKEMSNRKAASILHDINQAGTNSKGTKSLLTKLNGVEVSIELVGDQVNVRKPDQALSTPPVKTFNNMDSFVKAFYSISK